MLKDIIKKEILDHLLSSKFVVMFIACSALILLSVYMGVGSYLADKKVYDDDVAWDAQAMQPPNTYGQLLGGALKVHRAPQVLGTLVKGVEDAAGRVSNTSRTEVSLAESKYESNPLTAVFGAFDLLFIVKMVLSLFAVLLVYDTICGEREKGTLKLSLSNSVPRDRLLIGKAAGGYISLCLPLLFPVLLSMIYLSLHPGVDLSGEDLKRLCLIFLTALLYLTVFFCLGLLVSSLTARSSTSLIILLFIWSVWGMVVPKASVIIAGQLSPIPTPNEIYTQKSEFLNELNREIIQSVNQKVQEASAELTARLTATPPEQRREPKQGQQLRQLQIDLNKAVRDYQTKLTQESNLKAEENNSKLDRDYQLRKDAQAALAKNISRISPASALTFSATTLARTGTDDYNRFWKAALDYKPVVRAWVETNPDLRNQNGQFKEIDSATLAGMPQPAFNSENISGSFNRILPDLISIVVMIVLLTGGAYFAFIRCDVR